MNIHDRTFIRLMNSVWHSFQLSLKKALEIVLRVEILILYILFHNLKLQFDRKRKCDVKNTVKNVMQ